MQHLVDFKRYRIENVSIKPNEPNNVHNTSLNRFQPPNVLNSNKMINLFTYLYTYI